MLSTCPAAGGATVHICKQFGLLFYDFCFCKCNVKTVVWVDSDNYVRDFIMNDAVRYFVNKQKSALAMTSCSASLLGVSAAQVRIYAKAICIS